ncbi:MAG: glycosyltransferase family 2 protein [Synergistaceae bacterium]|nr:glycosyltransferase family 2 protein [Synergistaceae bacterium]
MAGTPLQSVIIPTFNRKDMLAETISSVLAQSQASLEVIVVDDVSTDGTEDYVRSIPDEPVRYFRNEHNSGPEMSRKFGLSQARGRYITFIDDDDYYTDREFFADALKIFADSEKPLAFVCADGEILETETGRITPHSPGKLGRLSGVEFALKHDREYLKPTSLFPAVFDGEIMRHCLPDDMMIFDTETYIWMALHGDVHIMPGIVGVYRKHPDSNTLGRSRLSEWMKRRMENLAERVRTDNAILGKLSSLSNAKSAKRSYLRLLELHMRQFTGHKEGVAYRMRVHFTILKASGYMPEVLVRMPYFMLKFELRRAGFLRRMYYALTGRGGMPGE